jgi:hypothetical protein
MDLIQFLIADKSLLFVLKKLDILFVCRVWFCIDFDLDHRFGRIISKECYENKFPIYLEHIIVGHVET